MDYNLIEKSSCENLYIKDHDFMYIWKTQKETRNIFENRLETQEKKLEDAWYNYRDVVYELRYWNK